jgi:diguanylate cyclase (GGDEF)-like protein
MAAKSSEQAQASAHPEAGLTIRAHIWVIVGILAVALIGVGAYQTTHEFQAARRRAGLESAFQARLAASAVAKSVRDASAFTESTAQRPSIVQLFATIGDRYALCSLSGGGSGLFPEGTIHFLDRTGFLFCSSAADKIYRRGIQYGTQPWFDQAIRDTGRQPVHVGPFTDPATSELSLAFAAPIEDADGHPLGLVVYELPVQGLASEIQATYGGRDRLVFDVTEGASGQLVSSSERASNSGPAGVDLRAPPEGAIEGLDGVRRFYRAVPAVGSGLTIAAGAREDAALADARRQLWGDLDLTAVALVLTLALGLLVNRRIGRPIRRLTRAVEQSARAVTPEAVALGGPREARRLVEEFNAMLAARNTMERQLTDRAMHDELTGLPNRVVAIDRLSQALERTRRSGNMVAVLSVDLDRFGVVNDSLGRDVGDRMLVSVGRRIGSVLRPEDTIARFYGDEFVVLCEDVTAREEAGSVADRIAQALREPIRDGDVQATVSASIGIALGDHGRDDAESLLRDADAARTQAKVRGKARFAYFDPSMREGARTRLDLENELRMAVERDELRLAYQPIVDLRSGRIVGAEALIRWHHPTRGVLLPGVFIEAAEENGLIVPIGKRVLDQACAQAVSWRDQGHPIRVSVNLSPRQFSEPDLDADVRAVLARTGLDPRLLCVEITENTLMREGTAGETLERLRGQGIAASIDDFGTGYSSLAYLQRFPIDELKIDRAFVRELGTKANAPALVAAIVGVARALDLHVVAEGIETEAQLDQVRALGCDTAQGYLIMRPQPPEDLGPVLELDAVAWPQTADVPGGAET